MNLKDLSTVGKPLQDAILDRKQLINEYQELRMQSLTAFLNDVVNEGNLPLVKVKRQDRIDIFAREDEYSSTAYINLDYKWVDNDTYEWYVKPSVSSYYNSDWKEYVVAVNTTNDLVEALNVKLDEYVHIYETYSKTINVLANEERELFKELTALRGMHEQENNGKLLNQMKEGLTLPNEDQRNCWIYWKNDKNKLHINTVKLIKESPKSLLIETTHTWKPWNGGDPITHTEEVRVNKEDFLFEVYKALINVETEAV